MKKARLVLQKLTKEIPPNEKMRHNFTIDDEGQLVLVLMTADFPQFIIEDSDFEKPIDELVEAIKRAKEVG